jgi:hypothetical protein
MSHLSELWFGLSARIGWSTLIGVWNSDCRAAEIPSWDRSASENITSLNVACEGFGLMPRLGVVVRFVCSDRKINSDRSMELRTPIAEHQRYPLGIDRLF